MAERREIVSVHLETLRRLFPIAWNINDRWRVAVFCGEEPYSREQDTFIHGLFRSLEALADPVRQKIEFFERHHTPFDASLKTDLRLYFQEVKKIVMEWKAPVLSSCRVLRTRYVSGEEAAALGLPVPQ